MKAFIFLATGFEEIEAITPIDILRRAGVEVSTVSITNSKEVVGAHAVPFVADYLFSNLNFDDADLLILPGGLPGTTNLGEHAGLKNLLLAHSSKEKKIGAICAAPTVLAKNGLLKGKQAIAYPGCEEVLVAGGASIVDNAVVKSGSIVTAKGPGLSIPFALQLVSELKGEAVAKQIQKDLCL